MQINSIKLSNFRNYESLEFNPGPGINYLHGQNGQGKTNILEAIYYCSSLRSHRTSKDVEMIRSGSDYFYIDMIFSKDGKESQIQIVKKNQEKKAVKIDGLSARKSADVIGRINTVLFSPEDLKIVKGAPADRRKFMDFLLCQISPKYYSDLQIYSNLLDHRNSILKEVKNRPSMGQLLEDIEIQMADYASGIVSKRIEFTKRINDICLVKSHDLSGGEEQMKFIYCPDIAINENISIDGIKETILNKFRDSRRIDIIKEMTHKGIQRDDWDIMTQNGSLKAYGSQGQQRTAVLTLKLAEIDIFEQVKGEAPIILLDDVMSELDGSRRLAIGKVVDSNQTFFTGTDKSFFEMVSDKVNYYHISKGKLVDTECSCT
ncbi:MAG: DNA replication/repair protein RecF [Clostridia bacterium]|nr:DNA replication/repair protein RecF [Clostridia bacterium]